MLVSKPSRLMAPTSERLGGVLRGTLLSTRRTPRGASVAPGQVQVTTRLIQEDQPPCARVEAGDLLTEGAAFSFVGFAGEERLFARQPQRLNESVKRGHAHTYPLAAAQAQAQFLQRDVGLRGDSGPHRFDGRFVQATRRAAPVADGSDVADPPPLAQKLAYPA